MAVSPRITSAAADAEFAVAVAVACAVRPDQVASLRSRVALAFGEQTPTSLLKQLEDQTLVALAAVADALDVARTMALDTRDWAVVAAPRRPGRARVSESIQKFCTQGAWGVSPHLIPHCSLHSLAGTLSQALGSHGPNLGTGGTPDRDSDVLLTAASFLADETVPGVWMVWTGWNDEAPIADTLDQRVCRAVVLGCPALTAVPAAAGWPSLRLKLHTYEIHAIFSIDLSATLFCLESLAEAISAERIHTLTGWRLADGGRAEWIPPLAAQRVAA